MIPPPRAIPALRRLVLAAHAALFPCPCFVCGRPLPAVQSSGACPHCWGSLDPALPPWCRSCGLSLPPSADSDEPTLLCGPCLLDPLPVTAACAAVVYERVARRFVLQGKEGDRPELLRRLGFHLETTARVAGVLDGCDAVVPVPSHPLVRLRRGFDPAAEVARGLSGRAGIPLRPRLLRRRWVRPRPMKGLAARARRAAAVGAYRVGWLGTAKTVLLVDDVLTTGATARACAGALVAAGARDVRLAVWARTPRRDAAGGF